MFTLPSSAALQTVQHRFQQRPDEDAVPPRGSVHAPHALKYTMPTFQSPQAPRGFQKGPGADSPWAYAQAAAPHCLSRASSGHPQRPLSDL